MAGYHHSPYAVMPTNVVTVPHNSSLNLSNFTIACWFRTTKDYTSDEAGYLVVKGDYLTETSGQNINYALLISTDVDPNNVLEVLFENSSGNNFYNVSGIKVNDGQWHFGVGTWDGTFSKIYVDGVLANTEDFSGQTPETTTRNLIIGGHENFLTYQGDLDEVRIWNVALTGAEISDLYNNDVVPKSSNLVYENIFGGSGGTPSSQNQNIVEWVLSGGKTNTTKLSSFGSEPSEAAAAIIQSGTPHNLFDHISLARATVGEDNYLGIYANCKSLTEGLPSQRFWLDRDTLSNKHTFYWGIESDGNFGNYRYRQWKNFDGVDDFISVASTAALQLTQFSISCWFNINGYTYTGLRGYLVNKGGVGSDSAGQNDNYSLYIDSGGNLIKGGFETAAGVDHYISSDNGIFDNLWHHAVLTYDQVEMKLYIDGVLQTDTEVTGDAPESTGTNPLVMGRNSRASDRFYRGALDEVMVWNNDLTAGEVTALYNSGTIPQISAMVYANRFDGDYKYAPFKRFNGTSDNVSVTHTASLSVTQYSLSLWFRTTKNYSGGVGYLLAKGSFGTETAGQNLNYSILMLTSNLIEGFHETSAGVNNFVDSTITVNDGKWHHIVVTYDQVNMKIYLDGVLNNSAAWTAAPDNNTKNLFIGSHEGPATFFEGDIDEVRIWNNDLTLQEVVDLFHGKLIPQEGALVYTNKFGDDNGSVIMQEIPSINYEPIGVTWQGADSQPTSPNLTTQDLSKCVNNLYTSYQHIWFKRNHAADATSQSLNAEGRFKLLGFLRRSNTDQGGGEGGSGTPQPVSNIKFGAVGDTDCNGDTDDVLDVMNTRGVDWKLFLGDLNYTSGTSCWFDRVGSISKVLMVIGNHDEDNGKRATWISAFGIPDGYYRKDIENICIIGMDSESSFSSSSDQYDFVRTQLQNASADNNIDWIVVMIHRPFITADSNHAPNEGGKADLYMPLFTQYKVDLVLQAHNHNYQRSKLVKDNPSDHENPTVVTSGSTFTKGQGMVVVTCGLGGHDTGSDLYSLDNTPSWQQYQQRSDNGYFEADFTGTNNSLLTGRLVNIDNEVMDSFTIQG